MVAFWFFISFVSETMKSYNYYCLRTRLDTKHSFPIINRIQICREKWENRIGPFLCYIWKCYIMDDDWISQNVFELIIKMHLYLRKTRGWQSIFFHKHFAWWQNRSQCWCSDDEKDIVNYMPYKGLWRYKASSLTPRMREVA